jgi:two-component system, cell cycle sensor histidine kinase and response regulator CckA
MSATRSDPAEGYGPALVQLCHTLANADTLPAMFDAVVSALVSITGFDRASALAFDGAGVMRFRAAHGLSVRYREAVEGHSPWTPDSTGAESVLVDDVTVAPELASLLPVFAAERIRACAFLPLQAGGRLLGKFMLYADRPVDWRTVDLGFATAAANLLASFLLREAAHERVMRARQMESLGLLAGGIAHDFNNLLTAVLGYAELLRDETLRSTPARAHVDDLLAVAERAADRARQLLGFARPSSGGREVLDLAAFLREAEPILARSLSARHPLRIELASRLPGVLADRVQLQQVLLHLLQNASEAMPAGGPIRITATVGRADHVELAVIDTGVGMDDATRRRLFEPLFTTRSDGRGTGLGLATCYAIVSGLGGDIAVRSAPGAGSTFVVALPAAGRAAAPAPGLPAAEPAAGATVLLVDDQQVVARALQRSLERSGHRVLLAGNGREALATLAREQVDVVVSDVVMPGMGGVELARELRSRRPALPVLLISGFIDAPRDLPPGITVLHKPFLPRELLFRLQELLGRSAAATGKA